MSAVCSSPMSSSALARRRAHALAAEGSRRRVVRRGWLAGVGGLAWAKGAAAAERRGAKQGDLVLAHYTGYVDGNEAFFDTTKGGAKYADGGAGVFRPAVLVAGGGVKPGQPSGLLDALVGMAPGETKTITLAPEEAFGSATARGPYGVVPGNSTVRYEIEVLRVSSEGPDKLLEGVQFCGQGGASEQTSGCADIVAR